MLNPRPLSPTPTLSDFHPPLSTLSILCTCGVYAAAVLAALRTDYDCSHRPTVSSSFEADDGAALMRLTSLDRRDLGWLRATDDGVVAARPAPCACGEDVGKDFKRDVQTGSRRV